MPSPDSIRILSIIIPLTLLLLGIFRKPMFATIGYMCLVYFKTSAHYPFIAQINGELIFAILALIPIIFHNHPFYKLSLGWNKINRYMYFFTACIFISFSIALDYQTSWDHAVYHYLKVLILYFMTVLSVNTKKDVTNFLFYIVIMYLYMAYEPFYGFISTTGGNSHIYGDIYVSSLGILSGHVALANNMNQMIPIALFCRPCSTK